MKRFNLCVVSVLASAALLCSGCSKAELPTSNKSEVKTNNTATTQVESTLMPYEMNKPWSITYTRAVIEDYKGETEQLDAIRKKADSGDLNAKYAYAYILGHPRYASDKDMELSKTLMLELERQELPLAVYLFGSNEDSDKLSPEEQYKKLEHYYRISLNTPELLGVGLYSAFAWHLITDIEGIKGTWDEHEDSLLKSPALKKSERIKEAIYYLKKASELGAYSYQPYLAEAYYHGIVVSKDLNEAYAWSKYQTSHYEKSSSGSDGFERCKRYVAEIPKIKGFDQAKAEARYEHLMKTVPVHDFSNAPLPPPSPVSSAEDEPTAPLPTLTAKVGVPCPATGFWFCAGISSEEGIYLRKGDLMPGQSYSKEEQQKIEWHLVKPIESA